MTEAEIRQKVASVVIGWEGLNVADGSHKIIIDKYNEQEKLPRGYKLKYTDSWCAGTMSAASMVAGISDIVPMECSCYYIIENAKKMNIWQEKDNYIPKIADWVLYDWDDGADYAKTDNKGTPEHVGMVISVSEDKKSFEVMEGNKSKRVGRRTMQVNGRYIRGFVCPNYASKAGSKPAAAPKEKQQEQLKTTAQIVAEVINGKWGTGDDRKKKLEAAGYDYSIIQAEVNKKLKSKTQKSYTVGDKVKVTGTIYGNGNGTGGALKKQGATMYIVNIVDSKKYAYYIGVSSKKGGARQGWAKPSQLTSC